MPEQVDAAVLVALEKLPADRWQTVRELEERCRGDERLRCRQPLQWTRAPVAGRRAARLGRPGAAEPARDSPGWLLGAWPVWLWAPWPRTRLDGWQGPYYRAWDLAPDGSHSLVAPHSQRQTPPEAIVVHNWVADLRARLLAGSAGGYARR